MLQIQLLRHQFRHTISVAQANIASSAVGIPAVDNHCLRFATLQVFLANQYRGGPRAARSECS